MKYNYDDIIDTVNFEEKIREYKIIFRDLMNACSDILVGKPIEESCRDNNVNEDKFEEFILSSVLVGDYRSTGYYQSKNSFLSYNSYNKYYMDLYDSYSWQQKLWVDLTCNLCLNDMPVSVDSDIVKILDVTLEPEEREIIESIYKDGKSLKDVGVEHHKSINRLRTTLAKCLSKLRRNRGILEHGTKHVEYDYSLGDKLRKEEEELSSLKSAYYDLMKCMKNEETDTILKMEESIREYKKKYSINTEEKAEYIFNDVDIPATTTNLDELGSYLSLRLYNTLKRFGITDLREMNGMSIKKIKEIRNMGLKSFLELLPYLQKFNIKIADNDGTPLDYEASIVAFKTK